MRTSALLLLLAALPVLAGAQDAGVQRQLIERQQRTDSFNLQLHQSQDALKAPPGARGELEARQFSDRQRLSNLNDQQLRDVRPDGQIQPEQRAYERQKADMERQPFRGPVMEVPVRPVPRVEPILPPGSPISPASRSAPWRAGPASRRHRDGRRLAPSRGCRERA